MVAGIRSSHLTRGACLAAYARSAAVRAGRVDPAGQRGNAGQAQSDYELLIKMPVSS